MGFQQLTDYKAIAKNSHEELHKVAKQVGDHEHRTTQKQDSCTRSSAYRTTLCNMAASTGKGAVQWRLTDNAATKSGIWAENHAALVRKVTSCAYIVVNAAKKYCGFPKYYMYVCLHDWSET